MHHLHGGEVALQRAGEDGGTVVLQRVRHGLVAEASLQTARHHCDAVALTPAGLTRVPLARLEREGRLQRLQAPARLQPL
jgi:hypothetical protein